MIATYVLLLCGHPTTSTWYGVGSKSNASEKALPVSIGSTVDILYPSTRRLIPKLREVKLALNWRYGERYHDQPCREAKYKKLSHARTKGLGSQRERE